MRFLLINNKTSWTTASSSKGEETFRKCKTRSGAKFLQLTTNTRNECFFPVVLCFHMEVNDQTYSALQQYLQQTLNPATQKEGTDSILGEEILTLTL